MTRMARLHQQPAHRRHTYQLLTGAELLTREAQQPLCYEHDGCELIVAAGGTDEHSAIRRTIATAVGRPLRRKTCRF